MLRMLCSGAVFSGQWQKKRGKTEVVRRKARIQVIRKEKRLELCMLVGYYRFVAEDLTQDIFSFKSKYEGVRNGRSKRIEKTGNSEK
jgi:hypothetical protein